jgi:hypothetical protein
MATSINRRRRLGRHRNPGLPRGAVSGYKPLKFLPAREA